MDVMTRLMLLVVFLIAGILCGVMFNIALGCKPLERGGVLGGILVGFLMFSI
jgi:hypothetical protein